MHHFRSRKKGLRKEYKDWLKWLFSDKSPTDYAVWDKKYIRDVRWTVNNFFTKDLSLDDFGYAKHKFTQLIKTYEDPDLLGDATERLQREVDKGKKNVWASVALSFVTGKKEKRKKSPCMLSAVVEHDSAGTDLTIFYRTTEVVRKFGADLVFLNYIFEKYIPEFYLNKLEKVTFQFAKVYAAALHYPLAYTLGLRVPKNSDYWFHKYCRIRMAKAKDIDVELKYSQAQRSFNVFRRWYYGEDK